MKSAPYIPVDLFTDHAYIYTRTKFFDVDYLKEVYSLLKAGKPVEGIGQSSIAEYVAAYKYYEVAYKNAFSFHAILGLNSDCEVAFISDAFDSVRYVIDALTLKVYYIKFIWMQKRLMQLVNTYVDEVQLHNLLEAFDGISRYPSSYIQAVIVDRGQDTEYMSIAPYILKSTCANSIFEKDYYASMIESFSTLKDSKYFKTNLKSGCVTSHDDQEVYQFEDVTYIMRIHDSVYNTKSDYIEIMTPDNQEVPRYFISRDFKHLVDAHTFRNYTVTHMSLQGFVKSIASRQKVTDDEIVYLTTMLKSIYD